MIKLIKRSGLVLLLAALIGFSSFAQDSYKQKVPNGWHLMSPQTSGFYGIDLDKAYEFLKGRKSKQIIVGVIDSGVDTTQEDLKAVLWHNPKEIPGNGVDDDHNGYVDDVYGWNFLGGKDGRNVKQDASEAARFYHQYKSKFENVTDPSTLSKEDQDKYKNWEKAKNDVFGEANPAMAFQYESILKAILVGDSIIRLDLKKQEYNCKELDSYKPLAVESRAVKSMMMEFCNENKSDVISNTEVIDYFRGEIAKMKAADTPPPNYRGDIVKDNYYDFNDKYYGNSDVMANFEEHGTHVSGIIGADRTNGKGINGIADNVKIMMIRVVPDGDEHDKDIALGIRYAVDNGAKVINMSFGKGVSPEKNWIDDAVRYAQSKGVLLVHAAGNENSDIDTTWNFPNPMFKDDGKRATNWITVGASGDPKLDGLIASFSNYGKEQVDVFAPGRQIYSTLPGNSYGNEDGTSMASPVVTGVAALIFEYFPNLTPEQVKMIIEKSVTKPTIKGMKPGTSEPVSLSDISRTGGIINAYNAVKLAAEMSEKTDNKKGF